LDTKFYFVDLYNKSRVRGDFQARFCERLGVKFPLPTRLATVMRKNKMRKCLNKQFIIEKH
jgi:hypothetical protein